MAMKLDIIKVYDRVEWSFLEAILMKMGFHHQWISRIMTYVSAARYTIVHGGHEIGPITPTREIRQGDSLSPYLFILCAEGLSALIQKYENRGWLHRCKVAQGAPRISHMIFVDKSYLYCKATLNEVNRFKEILVKFKAASRQKINTQKSSIFFSTNTRSKVRQAICTTLDMHKAPSDSLYLGLPSIMGQNKSAILGYLKDRVHKRIMGWEAKLLSHAGKEILVKIVAQSLPTYAMNVFLLPLEITRDIEKLMSKFW